MTGHKTDYSREQYTAIRHGEGPCMVIAGPGSGKTAVITRRVQALTEEGGILPERILTVTFTKAAAVEMMSRFHKMTDASYPETVFSTFHALFYRILVTPGFFRRGQGQDHPALRFMSPREKQRLAEETLKRFSMRYNDESERALLSAIARVKNGLSPERAVEQLPFTDAARFREMMRAYEEAREALGFTAYDDIAPDSLRALKADPALLAYWRSRIRYLQIDEYQDINPVQLAVVKLLSSPENNVFAVGDDDQAIYGFRGAKPDVMLRFSDDFPHAKRIALTMNYRSVPGIVSFTSDMIAENRNRFGKRLRAASDIRTPDPVKTGSFESRGDELRAIAKILRAQMNGNTGGLSDTAVICRTNAGAAECAAALRAEKLPCLIREKLSCLYDEPVIRDIEAYLSFARRGRRRGDFLKIMNKPVRYLAGSCLKTDVTDFQTLLSYYRDNPRMLTRIRKLIRDCEILERLSPKPAVGYIRSVIGYDRYLIENSGRDHVRHALQVLDRFAAEAAGFRGTDELLDHMTLTRDSLRTAGQPSGQDKNGVRLLTMHAAKGLEFDTVFLPSLNEGVIPSVRAGTRDEIEEERRLLYVAMTRARRRLYLSYVTGGDDPSGRLLPSSLVKKGIF
ncbi:MAG: ATP-dependent helicase [Lachnospiraceae bacterium]|nr:ATP-dependent helicase [Lachnospiraceae bacterium]